MAKNKKGKNNNKTNKQARNSGKAPSPSMGSTSALPTFTDPVLKMASLDNSASGGVDCGVEQKSSVIYVNQQRALSWKGISKDEIPSKSGNQSELDSGRESPRDNGADIEKVRVGTEVESTNHSTNVYITPDSDEGKCNRRDFIAGNEVSDEFKKLEAPKAHSDKAFSQSKQEFLTKPLSPPTDSKPKTLVNVPKEKARDDQEPALAKVFSSVVLPDQGGGQVQMDKRKTLPLPKPSKHPLEFEWSFWYSDPWQPWDVALVHVKDFAYIEDFWSLFNNLKPPTEVNLSYYLFKKGIRPEWEDEINELGGKWCLANGDFSPDQVWQELVLLFIGGAALDELSSHINGIYFARKKNYTTQITVWLDTTELHIINRIGDIIRTTLQTYLKVDIPMEFCKHSTSSLGLKKKPYRQSGHLHSSRIPP
ncbi:uncharacterized protein LOC111244838 isoform X2 [Varroa destructor]|uniref:Eukaryotic translation initiation factor 4E n=1 Tax=Varroa destructor TaxID=109461 RepID=A0A7M7J7U3_VARDE|nr:uncharacterized protein LOC111244838 isoform X2 [Varroa destructor]